MRRGFTLVELSIVLVIIGLLIGGILVGQSMINTAKIQALIRNINQYETAINNFKTNYKYYPGDDPFFIPAGDKNNKLGYGGAGPVQCNGLYWNAEASQIYTHLSQSGMLKDKYIPFSPTNCSGPHDDYASLGGIVAPYVELESKAVTALSLTQSKFPFSGNKNVNENFYMQFDVNAWQALPLESKLGSYPALGTTVGLSNGYSTGKCITDDGYTLVSCTDPTAAFASFNYYLNPL